MHEAVDYGLTAAMTVLNESGSINVDPDFEEFNPPTNLDFRLKSGSPARGAGLGGADMGAY